MEIIYLTERCKKCGYEMVTMKESQMKWCPNCKRVGIHPSLHVFEKTGTEVEA
jgi:predicted Zn-ribbon and HTH transcriptional regulator